MKTKSKKILFAVLACVLLMTVLSVSVFATGAGGSGDVAGPFRERGIPQRRRSKQL